MGSLEEESEYPAQSPVRQVRVSHFVMCARRVRQKCHVTGVYRKVHVTGVHRKATWQACTGKGVRTQPVGRVPERGPAENVGPYKTRNFG